MIESAIASGPFQNEGGAAVARAQQATGAVGKCQRTVLHLHRRMGLTAQLTHRLDHLRDAAAVGRVVVAKSTAVGVEGQLANAGDEVSVHYEPSALPALAKSQVLELHQDCDGEAVVQRRVLDVRRLEASLGKCSGAGVPACRVSQVDVSAVD